MATQVETALSKVETVARTLEEYAARGVFRGFSRGAVARGKITFKIVWHRDCLFEFVFDSNKNTMRFPLVLPDVPPDSSMYREFKAFLKSRQADDLPEHRRIDKAKAEIRPYNRGGNISRKLKLKDDDVKYGAGKIVHLVNEIFLGFLQNGLYYDYMLETFDLDPDQP